MFELFIKSFCPLIAACNCVFCAADFIHDCQFGQTKGRQISYNNVTVLIKIEISIECIVRARLNLGIRVGIGEVVFGNFLVMLSTRNLFLKNHIVYLFVSKLTSFFLFLFLIHPVEPPLFQLPIKSKSPFFLRYCSHS